MRLDEISRLHIFFSPWWAFNLVRSKVKFPRKITFHINTLISANLCDVAIWNIHQRVLRSILNNVEYYYCILLQNGGGVKVRQVISSQPRSLMSGCDVTDLTLIRHEQKVKWRLLKWTAYSNSGPRETPNYHQSALGHFRSTEVTDLTLTSSSLQEFKDNVIV